MVVTPDNSTLICAESFAGRLTAFDIEADGGLSNRRVWAELGEGGDGICIDAEDAVWLPRRQTAAMRVREGGEKLEMVELAEPTFCFACALGGEDGRTLFMLAAPWLGAEKHVRRPAERRGAHVRRPGRGRRLALGPLGHSKVEPQTWNVAVRLSCLPPFCLAAILSS